MYYISIRIFKVRFLRFEYDEYHYLTHHDLFISEFDPRKKKLFVFVSAVFDRSDPFISLVMGITRG
jgi:hypothetical protein